jgi:WD40 repeat protein
MKTNFLFVLLLSSSFAFAQTAHNDNVKSINFSSDGKYLVSASQDGTVKVWDFATRKMIKSIPVEKSAIFAAFTSDNKQVVTATWGGGKDFQIIVKIWDWETGNEIRTIENEDDETAYQCAYDPRGRYLATGSINKKIIIFDIETGERVRYLDLNDEIQILKFADGGLFLVAQPYSNPMVVYDTHSWTGKKPTKTKSCQVGSSSNGDWIVYFENFGNNFSDITMHVYNSKNNTVAHYASESMCKTVAFQNTKPVIAASFSKGIFTYNIENGKKLKQMKSHKSDVVSLCFSPDGKYLVSGGGKNASTDDCSIRLWDSETWKEVGAFVN